MQCYRIEICLLQIKYKLEILLKLSNPPSKKLIKVLTPVFLQVFIICTNIQLGYWTFKQNF